MSKGLIYRSNRSVSKLFVFDRNRCKTNLKKQLHKKCINKHTMNAIS